MRLLTIAVVTDGAISGGEPMLAEHVLAKDACHPLPIVDGRLAIGI
jgi:hypothetical protein